MTTERVEVLVAGKPIFRTTTYVIVDTEDGRFISQHRSEKAAEGGLRLRKGGVGFASLKILPVSSALARMEPQS